MSLQFQGVDDGRLLIALLAGVVCVLAAAGVWHLLCRRWRRAGLCLTGTCPPAIAGWMLLEAAGRSVRGDRRGARASLLAAGAVLVAAGAAGALVLAAGGSGRAIWMGLVGLEVAVAVGVLYSGVYSHLGTPRMGALMGLRCAAILVLLMILFKPAIGWTVGAEARKPYLPILLDRSASMATADAGGVRYRQAIQMLSFQRRRIEEHFRPVWHHFARTFQTASTLDEINSLAPSGEGTNGTNLALAVRSAAAGYDRDQLAGLLLLSDGIHNASDDVSEAVVEARVPVYAAGIGSETDPTAGRPNVQLLSAEAPMEVIENNVATVTVRVRATGMEYAAPEVQLIEAGGRHPLVTQTLDRLGQGVAVQTVRLKWTPRAAEGEAQPAEASRVRKLRIAVVPGVTDTVQQDNAAELHVLVGEPRIRLLYVEGSMRPEYKYLHRYLETDANVQFMGLIRISGNRFWAQGSIAGRKLTALPADDEDFALFDVLILGDLDRTFLTSDQMERIRKFVSDGGGLMMIGGHKSFGPGGYGGEPVETALPVVMGTRSEPQETTPFVPQLTAAGQAHPIFEGITGYFHGPGGSQPDEALAALPGLLGCVTVPRAKETATVLAVHPSRKNDAGPLVVLATQLYGAGRSAAFTADTTWMWYLPLAGLGAESPYQRFWGQLVRWLANVETKSRKTSSAVVMRLGRAYMRVGQTVRVLALAQDQTGRPVGHTARVYCKVAPADATGQERTFDLKPADAAGLFRSTFKPDREGAYRLEVTAVDDGGETLGTDELGLIVAPHSPETDRLARDEAQLRRIAESSDGRYEDIAWLPRLLGQIVERQRGRAGPGPRTEMLRLYNFTALFLVFVGLLTAEWLLRRSWQLH